MTKQTKEKVEDLLKEVKGFLDTGKYRFSNHAIDRRKERGISLPDVLNILYTGYHEKRKDFWDSDHKSWNYSIRGKTVDQVEGRIVVSFELNGLLIITIIRLE